MNAYQPLWSDIETWAGRALAEMDAAIADARRWTTEVNRDAIAGMNHGRACILHALGRDSEAGVPMVAAMAIEQPDDVAMLHLCMGDMAAAKQTLIDGLAGEATRDQVVAFVQLADEQPLQTAYAKTMRARTDALRHDPDLLKAVAKYGRILPWTLRSAAPPEVP